MKATTNAATKLLAVFLLLAATGGTALADRAHVYFGLNIGPYWGPWYVPPPAYYYPPAPVVIERPNPIYLQPQPAPIGYWYYCRPANAYYPYVNECPSGWEKVLPQPPGQQ